MSLREDASTFSWLLDQFVTRTDGVTDAVAVSSDGLLMANSETLEPAAAEQVAAIIAGFVSLGEGAVRCLDFEQLTKIVVTTKGGFVFVSAMADAGCLGVVANLSCDIGDVGYQMALLVERCGQLLNPELIQELKSRVLAA